MTGWTWDPTLYAGSAAYYARGRVPYPPEIATVLRDELGLDGTGRLLDVGCGPGSLTLLLAPLFAAATGVDADADMIAAGRAADPAIDWRVLRGEELPAELGTYRLVTFAQSFHWMDRPRVAAAVHGMLEPGGALVHVGATTHEGSEVDGRHPAPPRAEIRALVERYLGPGRRAGRSALPGGTTASGEDEIYRAAGFRGPRRVTVPDRVVTRDADQVVASVFSLSSSAPHLFGDRLPAFEADLRALLAAAGPAGRFTERLSEIALDLWRPA